MNKIVRRSPTDSIDLIRFATLGCKCVFSPHLIFPSGKIPSTLKFVGLCQTKLHSEGTRHAIILQEDAEGNSLFNIQT